MRHKTVFTFTLLIAILASLSIIYFYTRILREPASWPGSDAYVLYEQLFLWDGQSTIDNMKWNVTSSDSDVLELSLVSHGVNITGKTLTLTLGEANFTINRSSRQIEKCSDPNYIGEKWPFWIETNATIGSLVDILYGRGTIDREEHVHVLGQERDCWIVQYNWTTSTMKRWYDKKTGLCLKIQVVLFRSDMTVQIVETAVMSNIVDITG